MKTEAEVRVLQTHTRNATATRSWNRQGQRMPCWLGFRLLASRTVGEYISIVLIDQPCGNL